MIRLFPSFFVFLSLLVLSVQAAEPAGVKKAGEVLPDAMVQLESGAEVTLASLITKPTVLIFYRGGWCPFCNRHLAALAEVQGDLIASGAQLIALSPDSPAQLRAKPAQQSLPYLLVSDRRMQASQKLGIAFKVDDATVEKYKSNYKIDLEASSGETHHLLPQPAVFIVDAQGVIRFVHVNTDYKVRLEPAKILESLRAVMEKSPGA